MTLSNGSRRLACFTCLLCLSAGGLADKQFRMKLKAPLILLLSCWSGWLLAYAQPRPAWRSPELPYIRDTWGTKQGLPQNTVTALLQTRDGYLWFGTYGGVVRFDGVKFTIFNAGNTAGLKGNRIYALCEGRDGSLWIGTGDGGLSRYQQGNFTAYGEKDGLPSPGITSVMEDRDGTLWMASRVGLVRWQNGRFTTFTTADGLPSLAISSIVQDRAGALWVGTVAGLFKYHGGRFAVYATPDSLSHEYIHTLYESRDGSLWIGTRDVGLRRLQAGVITAYTTANSLSSNTITCLTEDHEGQLWIGHELTGTDRLNVSTGTVTAYAKKDGLSDDSIYCIAVDEERNLWIGTGRGGLNRLRLGKVTPFGEEQGLPDTSTVAVTEARDGAMWIASACGGVARVEAGRVTRYAPNKIIPNGCIWSLVADRDGSVWIGSWGGGLARYQNGRFTRYTMANSALSNNVVLALYQDRVGALWLGTLQGLNRWQNGQTQVYRVADGLVSDDVRFITEDRAGALWLGTVNGVSRFKDGKFTNYTTADGLPHNVVRAIHEDAEGTIWIGTYAGGLCRLKNGRLFAFTNKSGLTDEVVSRILDDGLGNFWLSGNQGITCVSQRDLNDYADGKIRTLKPVLYGSADGMKDNECNGGSQPAGWRARDGRLWFPTQRGVAIVTPSALLLNQRPPPVLVERCLVDRADVPVTNQLRIEPGQTSLEIHYTGLSLVKSEQVHFRYRLEGLSDAWVEAGTQRAAYYSYLPPGQYTFTVLAANSDGVWNTRGRQLQIVVVPHFWQTWWFRLLVVSAVAGLAFAFYRRRLAQLEHMRQVQEVFARQLIESQEAERKRIAAELHDSLGQNLLVIKNRALLGQQLAANPTAAQEQFGEITEAVSEALSETREIAYNLRPYHLDRVGLTSALEAMVEKVAEAASLSFTIKVAPVDNLFPNEVELSLYRIAQECLNNIVKHSQATAASFKLELDTQSLLMTIHDNGRGFAPEAVAADTTRRGFGLLGMAERVRLLGGVYMLRSAPGQGTTTTVKLPLPTVTEYTKN